MSIFKSHGSTVIIPANIFNISKIDNKTREEITKIFPSRADGAYFIDKFIRYLKDFHGFSLQEYIEKYFNEKWPLCPATNEPVGYKVIGAGIICSRFKKGKVFKKFCPEFEKACKKLSAERTGKNNPMYGKKAWNSGLNKNNNEKIKLISERITGCKLSESHKQKLKDARKAHPLKSRHTTKHSEFSKEKMRKATVNRWINGDFSFRQTSIEKKVQNWLNENQIEFIYQYNIGGFVADFACEKLKVIIECQGDFFHCNPNIEKYRNPKYEVQKRNIYRDSIKKEKYKNSNWKLIELWESEINSGEFKQILSCELKK